MAHWQELPVRFVYVGMEEFLKTRYLGRHFCHEAEMTSSNAVLSEMAQAGGPEGLVLMADRQTAGRGRGNHVWYSPVGCNLYFSVLLRPSVTPGIVPQLAVVSALSIREALNGIVGVEVKWPNDVWVGGRKLCGILCGMSCLGGITEHVIVGIGMNVNLPREQLPPELRENATSLLMETGRLHDREEILAGILNVFEQDYETWKSSGSLKPFLGRWREASVLDGREVFVRMGDTIHRGKVLGISDDGRLQLDTGSVVELVSAGEASIVRR